MRITYLIEDSTRIWGGVKAVFEAANALHARGHEVTIVSRSSGPQWMELRCAFKQSESFSRDDIPDSDVVVATFWTTVPAAVAANRGAVVHFCQGYEGDNPEAAQYRDKIEQIYRTPHTSLVTISPNLEKLLTEKFSREVHRVTYMVDHTTMHPAKPRAAQKPVRVALVGPYEIAWKDIRTGIEACMLARSAGLDLELVRVTNTEPHVDERNIGIPVEWHQNVAPSKMGEIYRSCDVFLGTSRGGEEGFFLPAVEAMACGVPCVLTDIPCFRAYGNTQYALFVEPQSPSQMAEALVIASAHPDVREELRDNGLGIAARYNLENHVAELEHVFAQLAGVPPTVEAQDENCTPDSPVLNLERIATVAREICAGAADARELQSLTRRVDDVLRAELHHQRGLLEYNEGHHEAALRSFEAARTGTTIPAELYNDLGVAHFACGHHSDARSAFERALQFDPDHPDARANLESLETALYSH